MEIKIISEQVDFTAAERAEFFRAQGRPLVMAHLGPLEDQQQAREVFLQSTTVMPLLGRKLLEFSCIRPLLGESGVRLEVSRPQKMAEEPGLLEGELLVRALRVVPEVDYPSSAGFISLPSLMRSGHYGLPFLERHYLAPLLLEPAEWEPAEWSTCWGRLVDVFYRSRATYLSWLLPRLVREPAIPLVLVHEPWKFLPPLLEKWVESLPWPLIQTPLGLSLGFRHLRQSPLWDRALLAFQEGKFYAATEELARWEKKMKTRQMRLQKAQLEVKALLGETQVRQLYQQRFGSAALQKWPTRKKLLEVLPPKERKLMERALEQPSLKVAEWSPLVRALREDPRPEVWAKLEKYLAPDQKPDDWLRDPDGQPVICPHFREWVELHLKKLEAEEIRQFLLRWAGEIPEKNFYYCQICGEPFTYTENTEGLVDYYERPTEAKSELYEFVQRQVLYALRGLKFRQLLSEKYLQQLSLECTETLYIHIDNLERKLLRARTNNPQTVELKKKLYTSFYVQAFLIKLAQNNPQQIRAGPLKKMIQAAAEKIITQQNPLLAKLPEISHTFIVESLHKIYEQLVVFTTPHQEAGTSKEIELVWPPDDVSGDGSFLAGRPGPTFWQDYFSQHNHFLHTYRTGHPDEKLWEQLLEAQENWDNVRRFYRYYAEGPQPWKVDHSYPDQASSRDLARLYGWPTKKGTYLFHQHHWKKALCRHEQEEILVSLAEMRGKWDSTWDLLSLVCDLCGFTWEQAYEQFPEPEKILAQQQKRSSFFNFFSSRCPRDWWHSWKGGRCEKCGLRAGHQDDTYFRRYEKTYDSLRPLEKGPQLPAAERPWEKPAPHTWQSRPQIVQDFITQTQKNSGFSMEEYYHLVWSWGLMEKLEFEKVMSGETLPYKEMTLEGHRNRFRTCAIYLADLGVVREVQEFVAARPNPEQLGDFALELLCETLLKEPRQIQKIMASEKLTARWNESQEVALEARLAKFHLEEENSNTDSFT